MTLRLENVGNLNINNTSNATAISSTNIVNSAGWIVGIGAGTAQMGSMSILNSVFISNSAGWVFAQSNTEGLGVILRNGTALIGSINLIQPLLAGTAYIGSASVVNSLTGIFSIANSTGWVFTQTNTDNNGVILRSGTALIGSVNLIQPLLAGTALVGSASVVNSLTGIFGISNSVGWVISVANTAGMTVNIINSAGWAFAQSNTSGSKTFATIEAMQMSSNGVTLNPVYAVVNASLTNNTIIAASAGRILKVVSWELMAQVAVNATWESGTGGTTFITGPKYFAGSGGMVAPFNPIGWFQTAAGSALNLRLSAATSIGGSVVYLII